MDELDRNVMTLIGNLDFTASVGNMSLGKRMAEKTAEMIQARSIGFQKGAAQQWEPNKEPYKSDKARKYNVFDLAGVRTGQMLSQESLRGETTVTATEVEMAYGTGEAPTSSSTGHIEDADMKVTDRQKAGWFTEGGKNQPERPFYELDQDIADEVFAVVVEAVEKMLRA